MASFFVGLVAVAGAAAHPYDASFDRGAVAAARLGCEVGSVYECFAGPPIEVRSDVEDSGACCGLCLGVRGCVKYNFQHETGACELFGAGAVSVVAARTGCASGAVGRANFGGDDEEKKKAKGPNVVFLAVESTDGRTWSEGYSDGAIPLPNIRALQRRGVEFRSHYSNAPVCCPSRATFWSGRHAHKIPHGSALGGDLDVKGVWNNYEGLPADFGGRLDQVLKNATDYRTFLNGKFDWTTGAHSESVRLAAWATYARLPYDVNASGGWAEETLCGSEGSVRNGGGPNGTESAHRKDWESTWEATAWMRLNGDGTRPFFVFTGHEIVHPDYVSNEYWSAKIDRGKVRVPRWAPLLSLHPCDFQSSMLKGCTPSDADAARFYAEDRRREVRALYYAMIAEFDAMVGAYVQAVDDLGLTKKTVFIVTSDHGDMQMEKQQFYKMVPYDASASVPMVIADGRDEALEARVVRAPTQLIDIFPTVLDLAGVREDAWPAGLDGDSLVPLLRGEPPRRDFVVSQFHGDNTAMSWFLVVANTSGSRFKYVVWGSGHQHDPLLFDLDRDPDETRDLAEKRPDLLRALDAKLRSVVDYPAVAKDVARYDHASFKLWADQRGPAWRDDVHAAGIRWDPAFDATLNASLDVLDRFLNVTDPEIQPCRLALAWPEKEQA